MKAPADIKGLKICEMLERASTLGDAGKIEMLAGCAAIAGNAFRFAAGRFQESLKRFPLAVFSIVFFYLSELFDLPPPYGLHWKALLLSYCGAFWFVSVQLFSESHDLSRRACNAISFSIFLPIAGMAAATQIVNSEALEYMFVVLFFLMFAAPFAGRKVARGEVMKFYNEFWGHIGRTIPVIFILFLISLAIFFWLYPIFGIPLHRDEFAPLGGIVISLLFPLIALMGIPEIRKVAT